MITMYSCAFKNKKPKPSGTIAYFSIFKQHLLEPLYLTIWKSFQSIHNFPFQKNVPFLSAICKVPYKVFRWMFESKHQSNQEVNSCWKKQQTFNWGSSWLGRNFAFALCCCCKNCTGYQLAAQLGSRCSFWYISPIQLGTRTALKKPHQLHSQQTSTFCRRGPPAGPILSEGSFCMISGSDLQCGSTYSWKLSLLHIREAPPLLLKNEIYIWVIFLNCYIFLLRKMLWCMLNSAFFQGVLKGTQ